MMRIMPSPSSSPASPAPSSAPSGTGTQAGRKVSWTAAARILAERDPVIARLLAEMFLIFQLRRPDVWPVGDLGVRRGYGLAWHVPEPTARELQPLGDPFRPYRSVAAWCCWRAAELYAGAADSALTRAL